MNKKFILFLVFALSNTSLFGEGFASETKVLVRGMGLRPIANIQQGFDVFTLTIDGSFVPRRVKLKETSKKYSYYDLIINNEKIRVDGEQHFFCPSRGTWVKATDLDIKNDTVFSALKGPLPIQDCKKIIFINKETPLHRISVESYENYFITEDLILVHNFVPAAIPLGYIIAAHALDLVATAAIALISAYAAEKATGAISHYTEKLFTPANYKADGSTTSKVSTPNNLPEGTPPPKNNGPDLSKVPPVAAAAEEARKNGGSIVKAVSDGVGRTATSVKNVFTGKTSGINSAPPNTQIIVNSKGEAFELKSTLDRIASGSKLPHRNDGSIFRNFPPKGQAQQLLPNQPNGYYKEFVYPTPGTNDPGAIRVVTGQNGEQWITLDHYKSFIQIK